MDELEEGGRCWDVMYGMTDEDEGGGRSRVSDKEPSVQGMRGDPNNNDNQVYMKSNSCLEQQGPQQQPPAIVVGGG